MPAVLVGVVLVSVPGADTGRARLVGPSAAPVVTGMPPDACAADVVARMTVAEQAGQVLMVGVAAASATPAADVRAVLVEDHVGSVYLRGRSAAGLEATAALTSAVRRVADGSAGVGLHVAVDQEGGLVQVLRGPGFTDLPPAVEQGVLPEADLGALAAGYGAELAAAGITMNLAPVADVTPPGLPNPPVGDLDRHYADDPVQAAGAVATVTAALLDQGVAPVLKHYPGLGRADGNTDTDLTVRDTITGPGDPFLSPFTAGIDAGAPVVMMSSAAYPRLDDEALAVFSPAVIRALRDDLGFSGVVMTDDLDRADAVAGIPVGLRAVAAVAAGVDLVLVFGAGVARTMAAALVDEARNDEAFAVRLAEAASRVVAQKADSGLVPACPLSP